jgi:hypothetical protein
MTMFGLFIGAYRTDKQRVLRSTRYVQYYCGSCFGRPRRGTFLLLPAAESSSSSELQLQLGLPVLNAAAFDGTRIRYLELIPTRCHRRRTATPRHPTDSPSPPCTSRRSADAHAKHVPLSRSHHWLQYQT